MGEMRENYIGAIILILIGGCCLFFVDYSSFFSKNVSNFIFLFFHF